MSTAGVWRGARVIVVSDGVAAGERDDASGAMLVEVLTTAGYDCPPATVVEDGVDSVAGHLRATVEGFAGLVLTTGGTGFGPRDLTPEGTAKVLEREAPGMAEAVRSADRLGRLSRGRAGTVGEALVVNLPGSRNGAMLGWSAIADIVPHALDLLSGRPTDHPHG